jgi:hypothetical protein
MTYREADGVDKAVAFARGVGDEQAALAFETPGVQAYIVAESFLVAYSIERNVLIERVRLRLYANGDVGTEVDDFLAAEAKTFDCTHIVGL